MIRIEQDALDYIRRRAEAVHLELPTITRAC